MTLYTYKAEVVRVIDGDTWIAKIDLGMFVYHQKTVRMLGYNAPELFPGHAKTKDEIEFAKIAKGWLESLLKEGGDIILETHLDRDDKYGRILADVKHEGASITVNEAMARITEGQWAKLRELYPVIYQAKA